MLLVLTAATMNTLNLYTTTCRLVLESNKPSEDFFIKLYKLLPALRKSLLCIACGNLVKDPHTPSEKLCQHNVCKECIGAARLPDLSCNGCRDSNFYEKDKQIEILLQCYIKLCCFIKQTGLIKSLCNYITNGGSCHIDQMIEEVAPETEFDSSSYSEPANNETEEEEEVGIPKTSDIQDHTEVLESSSDSSSWNFRNVPICTSSYCDTSGQVPLNKETTSVDSLARMSASVQLVSSSNVIPQNAAAPVNSSVVSSQVINSGSILPWVETQVNNVSHSNNEIPCVIAHQELPPCGLKVDGNAPQQAQQYSTVSLNNPIVTPQCVFKNETSKIYHPSFHTVRPIMSTVDSSNVKACLYNVRPTQVFSGTSKKELPSQGATSLTNQAMYSVTYRDNDSTKITLKRNPVDIENIKISSESDSLKCPSVDLIKKKRPKPKAKRKGCRCGNATQTPGKLTCCGQRCPCYVAAKACIECQCRGCRNPHRPGGKKVRPHIPQLDNIQIHQVQTVHPKPATIVSSKPNTGPPVAGTTVPRTTTISINYPHRPTYRQVQTVHNSQNMAGLTQFHTIQSGVHQFINFGSNMVDPMYTQSTNMHPKQEISIKPVNVISSVPAHLLINDDKSNSASDASDVDVDS